jgi:hypothetical protein
VFLVGQIHNRRIVSRKLQHKAPNLILRGRGNGVGGFDRVFKQFSHVEVIPLFGPAAEAESAAFCAG